MCGIAGYFGVRTIRPDAIEQCLSLMGRRGPDAAACRSWATAPNNHLTLLHSRLSIIDLDDRSNQPFQLGKRWIALNGELYNYLENRAQLEERGTRFSTNSDTEVLLAMLAERGIPALDDCEGMWSFAYFDESNGTLMLSRDRFGEKPLYILREGDGVCFGSEVKFIQALMGGRLEPNLDHVQRYLVNGYKSLYKQPATFFKGVAEVDPGSVLVLRPDGSQSVVRYWSPSFTPESTMSYGEAVAGVRERLIRAVDLRLRADVPLAFCMSGGIDSNALLSIAKRQFDYNVHGFTLFMDDPRYDERDEVFHMVRELDIEHTAVSVTTDNFRENLGTLVRQHDAPLFTISYYIHWLLMRSIASHGYRISISGTGADELFTGYYDHHNLFLNEIRGMPAYGDALRGWRERIEPVVRNPHLKDPALYATNPEFREHVYLNHRQFSSYTHSGWSEPFSEKLYTSSLLRNRMLNEMFHEAVPVILHEDDLNAMYFSIENRSPFLDRALFEHAYRIPSHFLVRDGFAKVVLRDALAGIVPEAILWNPRKVGFNAPVEAFVDFHAPDTRDWLLEDSPIFAIVRRDRIKALMEKSQLPNSESKFLFNFINSKVFLEIFG